MQADKNNSVASATSTTRIPVATPAEELRTLFPSIRGSNENILAGRNTSNSNRVGGNYVKRKRVQKTLFSDFRRDVILIKKPKHTKTLTGIQKSTAFAKGKTKVSFCVQKCIF